MVRSTHLHGAGGVGTRGLANGLPRAGTAGSEQGKSPESWEVTGWAGGRGCRPKELACRLNRWLILFVIVGGGGSAATMASGSEGCDDSVSWKL
jgi:hypothetical protein